jgi:predicted small lipoprotein YifL
MLGDILVAASIKLIMKKYSLIIFVLSLVTLVLSACGRKGPEAPPDVTPPAVILTSPINGAQNVAINSSITITFSEAMDASTINEQTITLSMGTGNVPGSVTYSDTTAVFKPASSLNPGTTYTITVDGGVKDVAGNAMATPVGFIFFTGTALTPTTVSLSAPVVTYGADGSVTVTVSSAAGTPTGDVSLSVDGGTPMTQTLAGGSTTFTILSPSVGTHTLNAAYAEQGNFGASSASGTLGVGVGATAMTLSAPTITYGANGSVTVTVSSAEGTPTGDVSLTVDGGTPMTKQLSNGSTTFIILLPSAITHTLFAEYLGQGTFGASSASGNLIVIPAATTTTITAPAVTYGTDGSVTVTVSSAAGTPTGDVSLSVDGGAATTQGLINGSTTFTIPSPSVGTHTLNAAYAEQGNYGASLASGTLGVGPGATAMSLTAPTVTYGADGIVTVTVSSAAGTPTGNVSLSVDGGTAVVQDLSGGSTTFTIPGPSVGSHTLNAAYAAQGNFGASSASGTLTVSKESTSTGLTSSLNPSTVYKLVTFTATVTPSTATGTVTFKEDSTVLGTDTLSGGVATLSTFALSVGSHSITAEYSGDTNFAASTSSTLTQTVKKWPH